MRSSRRSAPRTASGRGYAYWCVLCGVFVTALYTFRMMFMTFHGPERFRETARAGGDAHHAEPHGHAGDPHESPAVVTLPLVALAIPSLLIGALTAGTVLFGGYFGDAIRVLPGNNTLAGLAAEYGGPLRSGFLGFVAPPFWLALAGVLTAWVCFLKRPELADAAARRARWLYSLLVNKYYFDWFNENVLSSAHARHRRRPVEGRRPGADRRSDGQRHGGGRWTGSAASCAVCRAATSTPTPSG